MNGTIDSPGCERGPDLIAFLYNETNESETREFELHLKECSRCREEVASFGVVRESITAWRDEALAGFVSTPLATAPLKKSAIAALRQFFDLSPLWLKGATAFAVVAFCVLAVLVTLRPNRTELGSAGSVAINSNPPLYTQQDVDRIVKDALAKQQNTKRTETVTIAQTPKPKRVSAPTQAAQSRRPLSRAEREQLAADLRLLSSDDDDHLNLLGDRINQ